VSDDEGLMVVAFDQNWEWISEKFEDLTTKKNAINDLTQTQLEEYFRGERRVFDLPLKMKGTEFQLKVWKTLQKIPFGKILTYGEQADKMKNPKAIRAVGRTNGLNLISIIVPCHRVIGKNGSLTGYAGGMDAKKYLLEFEQERVTHI
jgi:methylated-DNA-[protein]-cysteine S-methyltransferase